MTIIAAVAAIAFGQDIDPAQERDLRCVATISYALGTFDDAKRAAVMPLATYYIGRVTGRDPQVDLEREIVRVIGDAAAFTRMLPSELTRCGKEMEEVGASLSGIGDALKRRAAEPRR